jgi:orotidine-5'-phosphate decarboxylase
MNKEVGLMVNSSRGILYASSKEDFALAARTSAINLQKEMNLLLRDAGF